MDEPENSADAPESAEKGARRRRVVVVDDHAELRLLTRVLIEGPRTQVVGEAGDGEDAIAVVEDLHPDIVLMDLEMPKLDGVEATRRISARHPDIEIIIVSASDSNVGDALAAGASGALRKGDLDELAKRFE